MESVHGTSTPAIGKWGLPSKRQSSPLTLATKNPRPQPNPAPRPAQQFRAAWADVFHVGLQHASHVNIPAAKLAIGHSNAVSRARS
jgi:hypothetical protein